MQGNYSKKKNNLELGLGREQSLNPQDEHSSARHGTSLQCSCPWERRVQLPVPPRRHPGLAIPLQPAPARGGEHTPEI